MIGVQEVTSVANVTRSKKYVLDDAENSLVDNPDATLKARNDVDVRDWTGATPCCKKTLVVSMKNVSGSGPDWYYRKCSECGAMVEIRCMLTKKRLDVSMGMAHPMAFWGNRPFMERQRLAVSKVGSDKCLGRRGRKSTISEVEVAENMP